MKRRSIKDGAWFWASKSSQEIALRHGGATGLAVYLGLCRLESDAPQGAKGEFYASAVSISRAAGIPARTVQRFLPILEEHGLIARQSGRHAGPSGAHCASKFTLLSNNTPYDKASQAPYDTASQAYDTGEARDGAQKTTPLSGGVEKRKANPRSARSALGGAPASGEEDYSWEPLEL